MGKHLPQAVRMKIIERRAQGWTLQRVADEFKLSRNTIATVCRKDLKTQKQIQKDKSEKPVFNYESSLDDIADQLYQWFKSAGMTKAALQCADKFFLAYKAHKGQADQVVNIQQTFVSLPEAQQLTIIQQSPQWTALVAELATILEGCRGCEKAKALEAKFRGEA